MSFFNSFRPKALHRSSAVDEASFLETDRHTRELAAIKSQPNNAGCKHNSNCFARSCVTSSCFVAFGSEVRLALQADNQFKPTRKMINSFASIFVTRKSREPNIAQERRMLAVVASYKFCCLFVFDKKAGKTQN